MNMSDSINTEAIWKKDGEMWYLFVKKEGPFATVYENGVWFTWDGDGFGGENSVENSIEDAKKVAAASAIMQGFIV